MIKLASWNVNSLKVRLDQVLAWLQQQDVDILALQETKLTDDNFPSQAFSDLGYHAIFSGQKTYNGVALISKHPFFDVLYDVPGYLDPQRRVLSATTSGLRVVNLYVPNGSEVSSDKYQYKLDWLQHVTPWLKQTLAQHPKLAVVGDFNIAPSDQDVHDPKLWEGSVHVSAPERQAFFDILNLGLNDSFRVCHPMLQAYSWWDYRAGGFRRNHGLRIDHILLSSALMSCCQHSDIDTDPRKSERPSDHAPAWVTLAL